MTHEVTEGAHVAHIANARKLQRLIVHVAIAVLARVEVNAGPLQINIGLVTFVQIGC